MAMRRPQIQRSESEKARYGVEQRLRARRRVYNVADHSLQLAWQNGQVCSRRAPPAVARRAQASLLLVNRYGERVPPLSATVGDDFAAARALHARAEPVRAQTTDTMGLIGALHNMFSDKTGWKKACSGLGVKAAWLRRTR